MRIAADREVETGGRWCLEDADCAGADLELGALVKSKLDGVRLCKASLQMRADTLAITAALGPCTRASPVCAGQPRPHPRAARVDPLELTGSRIAHLVGKPLRESLLVDAERVGDPHARAAELLEGPARVPALHLADREDAIREAGGLLA